MSMYYFNLRNDVSVDDEEGMDFPNLEAAREFGVYQARDLIGRTAMEEGSIDLAHHIAVADESGAVVAVIMFAEVVKVSIAGRAVI